MTKKPYLWQLSSWRFEIR